MSEINIWHLLGTSIGEASEFRWLTIVSILSKTYTSSYQPVPTIDVFKYNTRGKYLQYLSFHLVYLRPCRLVSFGKLVREDQHSEGRHTRCAEGGRLSSPTTANAPSPTVQDNIDGSHVSLVTQSLFIVA